MTDPSPAPPGPPKDEDTTPARELSWKERSLAGVPGLLAAAAGGYSVFVSDNQAGTASLMLFAAIFLLMAVQGTPLRRATKDSFELERRIKPSEVAGKARQKIEAGEADQAQAYIEGASDIDPDLSNDASVLEAADRAYVEQISEALARVVSATPYYELITGQQYASMWVRDKRNPDRAAVQVLAEYKLRTTDRTIPVRWLQVTFGRLRKSTPTLVISNYPLSKAAETWLVQQTEYPHVRFATWGDTEDDANIARALEALFAEVARDPEDHEAAPR